MAETVQFDVPTDFFDSDMEAAFRDAPEPDPISNDDLSKRFPAGDYTLKITRVVPGVAKEGKYRYCNICFEVLAGPEEAIGAEYQDHRGLNNEQQIAKFKQYVIRKFGIETDSFQEALSQLTDMDGTVWTATIKHVEGRNGGQFMNLYWNKQTLLS